MNFVIIFWWEFCLLKLPQSLMNAQTHIPHSKIFYDLYYFLLLTEWVPLTQLIFTYFFVHTLFKYTAFVKRHVIRIPLLIPPRLHWDCGLFLAANSCHVLLFMSIEVRNDLHHGVTRRQRSPSWYMFWPAIFFICRTSSINKSLLYVSGTSPEQKFSFWPTNKTSEVETTYNELSYCK